MSAACLSDLPPSKAPYTPGSSKDIQLPSPTTAATNSPGVKNQLEAKPQTIGSLASPVKRVLKAVGERRSQQSESPVSGVSESDESSISAGLKAKKKEGVCAFGTYAHLPEIVRLHDSLRGIYDNFKVVSSTA